MMFPSSFGRKTLPWQDNVGEFGDKFRKAREKKDISLEDVSNVTKIGSRMLQAIEEEHFDLLPGGVFNKGFIRAYAKHLGMDAEEAVTDYLTCLRQAQIDAHEVWEPEASSKASSAQRLAAPEKRRPVEPNKSPVKSQSPVQIEELPELQLPRSEDVHTSRQKFARNSDREIPWNILAIAAVVVVLAVILWIRRSHRASTATNTSPVKSQQAIAPSVPASVPATAPERVNRPSNRAPASNPATPAHSSTPNPRPQAVQSATAAHSSTAARASSSTDNSADAAEENDVTTRTFNTPVPQPSGKSTAPLTLVIRATETSWISVQADGQTVSQETLIAPAHASIRATREIVARIGNAAGVTFLWNGQEIPAEGAEAEVKTFVFDSNGMHVLPATPPPQ